MHTLIRNFTLRLAALLLLPSSVFADVASTFDVDGEGWALASGADPASALAFDAAGGNPGGRVVFQDGAQGAYDFFQAPPKFLGNRSAFYGGTLSFQLLDDASPDNLTRPVAIGDGAGNFLTHTIPALSGGVFTSFSFTLNELSGWTYLTPDGLVTVPTKAQFQSVLSDVTSLQIPADFHSGPENTSLDNVFLRTGGGQILVVGSGTLIPSGSGDFTIFGGGGSLHGDDVAFYGEGSGGQKGIYRVNRFTGVAVRAVDRNAAIPGGTGNFIHFETSFGLPAIPAVSGDTIAFYGTGSGGQVGLYALSGNAIRRLADTTTPVQNGPNQYAYLSFFTPPPPPPPPTPVGDLVTICFRNRTVQVPFYLLPRYLSVAGTTRGRCMVAPFADPDAAASPEAEEVPPPPPDLSVSGNNVVFFGAGSGGQQGIYAASLAVVGPPVRIANTSTAIPDGTGSFTTFPNEPSISGDHIVFAGYGSDDQGIYGASVTAVSPPFKIANTATGIPGGSGNFTSFPVEPFIDGEKVVFVGDGSGGQRGVYGARFVAGEPPFKIADTATAIPGGLGSFAAFGPVSVSATAVAFLSMDTNGQVGIFALIGGQLLKVTAIGDSIEGKSITGLSFSRTGLFGNRVNFMAIFDDESQGIYTFDVVVPPFDLRVTSLERIGNELRLRFTSLHGKSYAVQSRTDLTSGTWTTLPDSTSAGTGSIVQRMLPNAVSEPQQFYRVQEQP